MSVTKEDVIQFIENMTVLELSEFIKAFEERYGVTAAAPAAVAVAAAPAGDGVTALLAEDGVSTGPADHEVVAVAGTDEVVAALAVDPVVATLGHDDVAPGRALEDVGPLGAHDRGHLALALGLGRRWGSRCRPSQRRGSPRSLL